MNVDLERHERAKFRRLITAEVEEFDEEVRTVFRAVVMPLQELPHEQRFPGTLQSYVLNCFSLIDMLSAYWSRSVDQSERIAAFMRKYMRVEGASARAAVNIWRHMLMHEHLQRIGEDRTTLYMSGTYWELPKDEHLILKRNDDYWPDSECVPPRKKVRIISVGLLNLVEDIERSVQEYFSDLDGDLLLQENFEARRRARVARQFT